MPAPPLTINIYDNHIKTHLIKHLLNYIENKSFRQVLFAYIVAKYHMK